MGMGMAYCRLVRKNRGRAVNAPLDIGQKLASSTVRPSRRALQLPQTGAKSLTFASILLRRVLTQDQPVGTNCSLSIGAEVMFENKMRRGD